MSEAERTERLAAFLLGELEPAEREEFERRLADDVELRAELQALAPVVAQLEALPDDAWNPAEPPPLALPVTEIPAPEPARRAWWRWRPATVAVAGSLALVAVAVVVALGVFNSEQDARTVSVALAPIGAAGPDAHGEVTLADDPGSDAQLTVSGLDPNSDDYYELWLLSDDGLVSLGSFRVDAAGGADIEVPLPVDAESYDSFDISLEPDDGDPGHSGDSILRGPTPA